MNKKCLLTLLVISMVLNVLLVIEVRRDDAMVYHHVAQSLYEMQDAMYWVGVSAKRARVGLPQANAQQQIDIAYDFLKDFDNATRNPVWTRQMPSTSQYFFSSTLVVGLNQMINAINDAENKGIIISQLECSASAVSYEIEQLMRKKKLGGERFHFWSFNRTPSNTEYRNLTKNIVSELKQIGTWTFFAEFMPPSM